VNRNTLRTISKIALAFAIFGLTVDVTTATIVYLINPAYFYRQETNRAFANMLVYQTLETTLTFIGFFLITNGLFLASTTTILYLTLWRKPPETPLTELEARATAISIVTLFVAGLLSLHATLDGNVRSILYLLNGGY
jgi:hypothetical protein